jgi:hypothetical protein
VVALLDLSVVADHRIGIGALHLAQNLLRLVLVLDGDVMAGVLLGRAIDAHHHLLANGQDSVGLVAHGVLVRPDHVVTGQHPGIAAVDVHQPAAAHAHLAVLHRVLVETVERLLGAFRVSGGSDIAADLLLEAARQGADDKPNQQCQHQQHHNAHEAQHKGIAAVDLVIGQHQRQEGAAVLQTDVVIAETGVDEVVLPQLLGLIVHPLQGAAHGHVRAVPLVAAILVVQHARGVVDDRLGVVDFGRGHFQTDVNGCIRRVDGHNVLTRGDFIALAALAADGFGVVVDQGIDVHRDILSLQGEDVLVVVQRLKVGGAGQHLDDAGAKHHAEGGRDDAQHDDAPQIAEQGFLFQGFQHFVSSILFVRVHKKCNSLFIYCQPVTHVCAKNLWVLLPKAGHTQRAKKRPFRSNRKGRGSAI